MIEQLAKKAELIQDEEIKQFTLKLVRGVPLSNWTGSASKNHHLPDERGIWGNAIHTMRVVDMCLILSNIFDLEVVQQDYLLSAAILHDCCRRGKTGLSVYTVPEHPYLVRHIAKELGITFDYSEDIFNIIEPHMGRWTPTGIPSYITNKELSLPALLHIADCVEANLGKLDLP